MTLRLLQVETFTSQTSVNVILASGENVQYPYIQYINENDLPDQGAIIDIRTNQTTPNFEFQVIFSSSRSGRIKVFENSEVPVGLLPLNQRTPARTSLNEATAPSVNDDELQGFGVGSRWHDSVNNLIYTCIDATAGAAQWRSSTIDDSLAAQASLSPGLVSFGDVFDYPNSGGTTSGLVQFSRVYYFAGTTISQMRTFIDSGQNPSRSIRLGIYSQADPTSLSGVPLTRQAQTASTSTGSLAGFATLNLTSSYQVPETGYYWHAVITDASQLKFAVSNIYRSDFLPKREEVSSGVVLPATTGTLTNQSTALIYVAGILD